MRHMGMAGKHDIGASGDQIAKHGGGVMDVGWGAVGGRYRGVVHHGDMHKTRWGGAKGPHQSLRRGAAEPAGFPDQRVRGVHACQHGAGQDQHRFQHCIHPFLVAAERRKKS